MGRPAYRDAPAAPGTFPLVLLSHGGLRSAPNSGAWLGEELADAGFMVVEVNGPRPRSADEAVDEIWRRPQDISHALDRILDDPGWSAVVDETRIAVAGYALGGTAALALAGGEFDADAFVRTCELFDNGPDCAWYAGHGVSLTSVDEEALERSHRDPRINAAIAIDPEYVGVVLPHGLRSSDADVLMVGFDDNDPSVIQDHDWRVALITAATRCDAFPVCTERGGEILAEEGGDTALCDDDPADRSRIHSEIANHIVSFLGK